MSCKECKHYAELKEPRKIEDNVLISGYCFATKYNMNKGLAVFAPDCKCNDYKGTKGC